MSNTFGTLYKVDLFGESHSAAIGVVIDGVPAGMRLDMERVAACMKRRAPNAGAASTKRKEADVPEILSGFHEGKTTGAPLAAIIRNADTRSADYQKTAALMRPGHADYTGHIKYNGANDIRGGGHFSGRLTAPLVFAGAVARQCLESFGISIGAHITAIADITDDGFGEYTKGAFEAVENKAFPVVNDEAGQAMLDMVIEAAEQKDSVGGIIECAVCGLPVGLGEPFFDSMESVLSHIMFSIPAVKGIEFGAGFGISKMRGSEANDRPYIKEGKAAFATNHNGGINGGISNGMPIVFRVAVKPTPSIGQRQQTVNMRTMEESEIEITGRHDACIVPRAVEAVKCAAAIALYDLCLLNEAKHG